jgi:hypothetical protein
MLYSDFERLISNPRMVKYCTACGNDSRKAMTLYRSNIRLSNEIFSILSLFEIALRNAIDTYYRKTKGNNWLRDAAKLGSRFLRAVGCERSLKSIEKVIADLGANYTPDEAISQLTFGFWTYKFASKEFAAAGSTLLKILPGRPFGTNHTKVFKELTSINRIRNRIAHHEPICFGTPISISTVYAAQKYYQIVELLQWVGVDAKQFLYGIDRFRQQKNLLINCNPDQPTHIAHHRL